jgi:hypothetical protein
VHAASTCCEHVLLLPAQNNAQLGFFFFRKEDAEAIVDKVGWPAHALHGAHDTPTAWCPEYRFARKIRGWHETLRVRCALLLLRMPFLESSSTFMLLSASL